MARTFRVRFVTFIPQDWVNSPIQLGENQFIVEYKGDNRGFDKNTANTGRYRTAQQVTAIFRNTGAEWFVEAETGSTTERVTFLHGKVSENTKKASTDGITYKTITAGHDFVTLGCKVHSGNPFIEEVFQAHIDYDFVLTIRQDGTITLTGDHDAFPAYEVYANVDGGTYQNIYLYDPRDHGKSAIYLLPPMDVTGVSVNRKII
ncbi:DUF3238 domain-containing protein [Paenibacillus alvei]|uniref:DUF3238 domain-containing protein n=1 Tax=Paenibacillus alvei TaxID=44250 RepID=UPI0022809CF9|nr:DUF3238 domain-containing protein [Paenibacillus alvei]